MNTNILLSCHNICCTKTTYIFCFTFVSLINSKNGRYLKYLLLFLGNKIFFYNMCVLLGGQALPKS